MPDASLPRAKRARSLTIVGTVDVVFAALGLILSSVLGMVVVVLSIAAAWHLWSTRKIGGDPDFRSLFASGILTLVSIGFVSTLADSLLLATGIQLLRRSGVARPLAIGYAVLISVLGAMDVWLANQLPVPAWAGVLAALLSPAFALAQAAAFFVVPSWRALNQTRLPSAPAEPSVSPAA